MPDSLTLTPEQAQSRLNQAVSKWVKNRTYDTEWHLRAAFEDLQDAVGTALRTTVGDVEQPTVSDEREMVPPCILDAAPKVPNIAWNQPRYDLATEARIANLLAVVSYPAPIPGGDLVRKEATRRALQMLGLDAVPTAI